MHAEYATPEEFIEMSITFQDLALQLLSQQRKMNQRQVADQIAFVKKMYEMMLQDIETFSLDAVADSLPGNDWLRLYKTAIPLIEQHVLETAGEISEA